jgi:hypothetical protein
LAINVERKHPGLEQHGKKEPVDPRHNCQNCSLNNTKSTRCRQVPVEEKAIAMIANNSMAIDVYCWLAYRLHSLSSPKLVTWKALHASPFL